FRPAKFLENLFLLGGHPDRGFDHDAGHQIAPSAAVENAHARAAMAQLLTRLDARRNLELDRMAVDARQVDRAAERRRREADRAVGNQRCPLPRVDRVTLHVDEQVKVAARRTANARFALAGDTDAGAL